MPTGLFDTDVSNLALYDVDLTTHGLYDADLAADSSGPAANIVGASSVTGLLVGSGTLVAVISGTSVVAALLTGTGTLAASISGTSSVVALLTGRGKVSVSISGTSSVVATLTATGVLASSISGISSVVALLKGGGPLSSTILGTSVVTAALLATAALNAAINGSSSVTGAVTGSGAVLSSIFGTSSVVASLSGFGTLDSDIDGTSSVVALLIGDTNLSSSIFGTSVVSGLVTGLGLVVSTIGGQAIVVADLTSSGSGIAAAITGTSLVFGVLFGTGSTASNIGGVSVVSGSIVSVSDLFCNILGMGTVFCVSFTPIIVGVPIRLFGVSQNSPSTIITTSNALQLFSQVSNGEVLNVTGANAPSPDLYKPSASTFWSPKGTADNWAGLGQRALPGQLLVAPGNGRLSGKIYYVVASGIGNMPPSGSAMNLVLGQNYFSSPGSPTLPVPTRTDIMATLPSSQVLPAGPITWSLVCILSGNGRTSGSLKGQYTIVINGVTYRGTSYSNVDPNREPELQLSLGVQFTGALSGSDVFELDLFQYELQQLH